MPEPTHGKRRRGTQAQRRADGRRPDGRRPDGRRRAGTAPVTNRTLSSRLPGTPWLVGGAIVVVVVIAAIFVLRPGGGGPATGGTGGTGGCPTSQPTALAAGQTRTVTIQTVKGAITIKVKADLSPIATAQFVALASCGFYDGSPFHRVVPDFVIQGGSSAKGASLGYTIKDEAVTATYGRGVVAMARTLQPNSVDSQFFIVLSDAARAALVSANTYQIVGTVTAGMDAVDAIAAAGSGDNVANPVKMTSVTVANP